jgi:DNA-directed RNA polymerase sigma subunit (sigma70/sigma32)
MLDDFESRMEARDIVRRSFACVNERDQDVVIAREVYGVTLRELAGEYGVSVDRIRQLEARGLRRANWWARKQLQPEAEVRRRWRYAHGLSFNGGM